MTIVDYELENLLDFWFSDKTQPLWYKSTPEFDAELKGSYEALWERAVSGRLDEWCLTAEGCLALVILLDQLPLNMFRNTAKSFSSEQAAVQVARLAIERGFDHDIDQDKLGFLYTPLMHSEDSVDQELSVKLFTAARLDNSIRFASHHRDLIIEFGRFPHRNKILGRRSTEAEIEYLASKRAFLG